MEQSFQQGNSASEWSSYVKPRQTPTNSFQHVLLMLLWCFWMGEVSSLLRTNEKFGLKIKVSRGVDVRMGKSLNLFCFFFLIDYKTLTYLHVSWDNRRRHEMWMRIRWKNLALCFVKNDDEDENSTRQDLSIQNHQGAVKESHEKSQFNFDSKHVLQTSQFSSNRSKEAKSKENWLVGGGCEKQTNCGEKTFNCVNLCIVDNGNR